MNTLEMSLTGIREIFDYLHSHNTRLEPTTYLEAFLSV